MHQESLKKSTDGTIVVQIILSPGVSGVTGKVLHWRWNSLCIYCTIVPGCLVWPKKTVEFGPPAKSNEKSPASERQLVIFIS